MNVFYLPLDSRPCNTLFPVQLLDCAGYSCTVPPLDAADFFTRPAYEQVVSCWLENAAREADVLILSVDKLAYGSLLASRENDVPLEEARARVLALEGLKRRYPKMRILAFSVLMRSSISTLKAEDVAHHHAITAYSQARHRALLSGKPKDARTLEEIESEIPPRILAKYLRVRARNFAINRACVDLARAHVIDRLLLLQEDAQPLGLHKMEQEALAQEMDADCGGRIAMHNGTDEAGCLCAALACAKPLKLHIHALGGDSLSFVAKYEDRPFFKNIESHARFAGIRLTGKEEADKILCVLTPGRGNQQDSLSPKKGTASERARFAARAQELAAFRIPGKPVGLLDVCYANGGASTFIEALARHMKPLSLAAYAAWNTASNSLGTALAQLALGENAEKNRRFTATRFLDDLIYQGVVRDSLQKALLKKGEDPYHLTDLADAERMLTRRMATAVSKSPAFLGYTVSARYALPWPRTFEANPTLLTLEKKEGASEIYA